MVIVITLDAPGRCMTIKVKALGAAMQVIGAFVFALGKPQTFNPVALHERRVLSAAFEKEGASWRAEIVSP